MGCTVVAAESGIVTYAGWYNSGGYTVIIDHGNGLSTMYCHMQNTIKVRSGQRVSRGQAIGNIGATGYVTGPHLHFEVKVNGRNVNPALYL
jgi:murein DD-endopeptidase MepM/ murein hydrolase activator NlpD